MEIEQAQAMSVHKAVFAAKEHKNLLETELWQCPTLTNYITSLLKISFLSQGHPYFNIDGNGTSIGNVVLILKEHKS